MSVAAPLDGIGATNDDILLARQLRRQAEIDIQQTRTFRDNILVPIWDRLTSRAVRNSLGEEYDLSMEPKRRQP